MKPFELMIWLLTSLMLLRQILVNPKPGMMATALLAAALLLIGTHLLIEGWRKPVLLAALSLLALVLLPWLIKHLQLDDHGIPSRLLVAAAGLLLVASTAANWLRPAVRYPVPGGPYPQIGVISLPVEGSAPSGDQPTSAELRNPPPLVKLWYPAKPGASLGLSVRDSLAEALARFPQRGSQLAAPAHVDAPPFDLPNPAPLLFYFPGWPGTSIESAALVRELVSHGYYVATVEYPARLPGMSEARLRALKAELERSYYYGSESRYQELLEVSRTRVRSRARDAALTLDRLATLVEQPGQPFNRRFDASRAGIIGFSLGGAVATQAVNQDVRFVTAVNLDGRHWAEGRDQGATRPMLMISQPLIVPDRTMLNSDDPDTRYNAVEDADDYARLNQNLARHGGMHVTIRDAMHFNFADLSLTSPLPRLVFSGPILPLRAHAITHAYALAWFDRALRGMPSALLDTTISPFPEVDVSYWPARNAPSGQIKAAGSNAVAYSTDVPKPNEVLP